MGSDDSDDTCVGAGRIAPMRHASDRATARRRRIADQTTSPVAASSAAMEPSPVLMYSRPPTISGVFCDRRGAGTVLPLRTASGMVDCLQTIRRSATLSFVIWSAASTCCPPCPPHRRATRRRPPPIAHEGRHPPQARRQRLPQPAPSRQPWRQQPCRSRYQKPLEVCFSDDWKIDGVQACTRKRGMAHWRQPPGYTELSMPPPEPGDDERSGSRPQAAHGAAGGHGAGQRGPR